LSSIPFPSSSNISGGKPYVEKKKNARNLAHPMLVERQAIVTSPYSLCDEHKSNSQVAIACEHKAKSPCL